MLRPIRDVLFALLVTLLMVPALYLIGEDCAGFARRLLPRLGERPRAPQNVATEPER